MKQENKSCNFEVGEAYLVEDHFTCPLVTFTEESAPKTKLGNTVRGPFSLDLESGTIFIVISHTKITQKNNTIGNEYFHTLTIMLQNKFYELYCNDAEIKIISIFTRKI